MAGFRDSFIGNVVGDRISNLSTFGMKVDDMLIKNTHTKQSTGFTSGSGDFDGFGGYNNDWDLFNYATNFKGSVSQASEKRDYDKLRQELRRFSTIDIIEEIVETLADESIVYDDKGYFCEPSEINADMKDEIIESYKSNFKKIYSLLGLNDGKRGWDLFKKWLIDGYLAFEIIYNDAETEIVGFKEIDPAHLKFMGYNKQKEIFEWKYKDKFTQQLKTLPDSKVVYISYEAAENNTRISYIQRLIRAYNVLDIMEQSRVIYAVTQSVFNKLFTIPVGGKSKTQAKQSLATLISSYKEKVHWDSKSGELEINGSKDLPFYKEYWFPEKNGNRPQVDSIRNDGPDLSNMEPLDYFAKKLYRASKIPANRFEEAGGGRFNLGGPSDIEREEIRFNNFVGRIRTSFKELITKPLWIQMVLQYPSLENDSTFEGEIGISFNKNNLFEDMKKYQILETQAKLIDTLARIESDKDDRSSYFSKDVLVREYLDIPKDVLDKNQKVKDKLAAEADDGDDDGGGRRF